jgi:hypothetical protein
LFLSSENREELIAQMPGFEARFRIQLRDDEVRYHGLDLVE